MHSRQLGTALFAAVCLALAAVDLKHPLDGKFIGLVLLAVVPALVPWLTTLVSSLKFGGLELKFRELKQQVDQNKQMAEAAAAAAMTGQGKASDAHTRPKRRIQLDARIADIAGERLPHDVPIAGPAVEAGGAIETPDPNSDPNKGRFGGANERDGQRLDATVSEVAQSTEFFLVHAWVQSSAGRRPLRDGTEVVFYLHPTFAESAVRVQAANGIAAIDRLAWGAFTLGAVIGPVRLELDLAELPDAPAAFRTR